MKIPRRKRGIFLREPRDERSSFYAANHVSATELLRGYATMMVMYWVYIMESENGSWYIGQTSNLQKRIREHKNGYGSETTAKQQNWKCIYCEGYVDHKDAIGRERYLKSGAGRRFLKKQLAHYLTEKLNLKNHLNEMAKL